jgi:signal transduction histidine kinase
VEARARNARVHVADELPADLPRVMGNAAELEQVFLNLFINALDAMPQGGTLRVRGCVTTAGLGGAADWRPERPVAPAGDVSRTAESPCTAHTDAGGVVIEVGDTGTGIDPSIRERVFEPFLTSKGGSGTGLGLSICQGLVRSHGGEIWLDSEQGSGTRATVVLPVCVPAPTRPILPGTEVQHA